LTVTTGTSPFTAAVFKVSGDKPTKSAARRRDNNFSFHETGFVDLERKWRKTVYFLKQDGTLPEIFTSPGTGTK